MSGGVGGQGHRAASERSEPAADMGDDDEDGVAALVLMSDFGRALDASPAEGIYLHEFQDAKTHYDSLSLEDKQGEVALKQMYVASYKFLLHSGMSEVTLRMFLQEASVHGSTNTRMVAELWNMGMPGLMVSSESKKIFASADAIDLTWESFSRSRACMTL